MIQKDCTASKIYHMAAHSSKLSKLQFMSTKWKLTTSTLTNQSQLKNEAQRLTFLTTASLKHNTFLLLNALVVFSKKLGPSTYVSQQDQSSQSPAQGDTVLSSFNYMQGQIFILTNTTQS